MADGVVTNLGSGGPTVKTDDLGAAGHVQYIKLLDGTDNSAAVIPGDATNGLDVDVTRVQGTVTIGDGGGSITVDDGAGSITVDGSVSLAAAIPAGNNNIGDVDVVSEVATAADNAVGLPALLKVMAGWDGTNIQGITTNAAGNLVVVVTGSLPAGTNNIGDVDVLTVPAPLSTTGGGTEAAAHRVTIANDSTGVLSVDDNGGSLTVDGTITANLAAGTNNIGDVDVLTLPALPAGTNNIGDVDVLTLPALIAGSALIGNVGIAAVAGATGLSKFHLVSGASTNATNLKASAGKLHGWYIYNSHTTAARKVAFHNNAGTPTAGTGVVDAIVIPPLSAANAFSEIGIAFSTGIAITTVTGLADADGTAVAANDLIIGLWYV